jgi:hypothetical protein
MKEIGFIHMTAAIFGGGLIDDKVFICDSYQTEKARIGDILMTRYAIESLSKSARDIIDGMISREICTWWIASRYNVQVDQIRVEIMDFINQELISREKKIVSRGHHYVIVDDISVDEFSAIQHSIQQKWGGLITYYAQVN